MGRNAGTPHYMRILADLQRELDHDPPPPGRALPSERALARRYGVARHTARRALEELRARGRIVRLQGAGSYSADAAEGRVVALGYLIDTAPFDRTFAWLGHRLRAVGYALAAHDTGLHGEHIDAIDPDSLAAADAVVWFATSHPEGLRLCRALRRKLPNHIPLVLVNDSLGTTHTGRRRVDYVHFDVPDAARRIVEGLLSRGIQRPVLVRRRDVAVGYLEMVDEAVIATLAAHGIPDPTSHVMHVDTTTGDGLAALWQPHDARPWTPDALLLCWSWAHELKRAAAAHGCPIPDGVPIVELQDGETLYRTPQDFRAIGEICADLVASRILRPSRPNLTVSVNLPVIPV